MAAHSGVVPGDVCIYGKKRSSTEPLLWCYN
jgi:hypothetical protein